MRWNAELAKEWIAQQNAAELTQATHDQAIEQLLAELNTTQTIFPGTSLTLVFQLGSA